MTLTWDMTRIGNSHAHNNSQTRSNSSHHNNNNQESVCLSNSNGITSNSNHRNNRNQNNHSPNNGNSQVLQVAAFTRPMGHTTQLCQQL